MTLDNDFMNYFAGDTLLEQRRVELLDAELMLKRWQSLALIRRGVALAYAQSEVARYQSRIEALNLSIQVLELAIKINKGNTNE